MTYDYLDMTTINIAAQVEAYNNNGFVVAIKVFRDAVVKYHGRTQWSWIVTTSVQDELSKSGWIFTDVREYDAIELCELVLQNKIRVDYDPATFKVVEYFDNL